MCTVTCEATLVMETSSLVFSLGVVLFSLVLLDLGGCFVRLLDTDVSKKWGLPASKITVAARNKFLIKNTILDSLYLVPFYLTNVQMDVMCGQAVVYKLYEYRTDLRLWSLARKRPLKGCSEMYVWGKWPPWLTTATLKLCKCPAIVCCKENCLTQLCVRSFRWISGVLRGKNPPEKHSTFLNSCWPEFRFLCQPEKQNSDSWCIEFHWFIQHFQIYVTVITMSAVCSFCKCHRWKN